jgi:hypothetical protein
MSEDLDRFDDRERELYATMILREDVLEFLRSPVGRYLHGRAKLDLEAAKEDLLDCNPLSWWGRRKILKIQHRADIARSLMRYCVDAINDGNVAEKQLTD